MNNFEPDGVRVAAADLESAQYALDNARYVLRDEIVAALEAGASKGDLAEEAGLTSRELDAVVRLPD